MKDLIKSVGSLFLAIVLAVIEYSAIYVNYNYVVRDMFKNLPEITLFQTSILMWVVNMVLADNRFKHEMRETLELMMISVLRIIFLFMAFGLYWVFILKQG